MPKYLILMTDGTKHTVEADGYLSGSDSGLTRFYDGPLPGTDKLSVRTKDIKRIEAEGEVETDEEDAGPRIG